MRADKLVADLRLRGVCLWRDGDLIRVNAPRGILTAALKEELASRKKEILGLLGGEALALPIVQTRVLARSESGLQVLEIQPVSPPGAPRWEKRLLKGEHVALVSDSTSCEAVMKAWIRGLQARDERAGSGNGSA